MFIFYIKRIYYIQREIFFENRKKKTNLFGLICAYIQK